MFVLRNVLKNQVVTGIPGYARIFESARNLGIYQLSSKFEVKCNNCCITRGTHHSRKQTNFEEVHQSVTRNCYFSIRILNDVCVTMDTETGCEDSKCDVQFNEQQRKREREKELPVDASPPCRKRIRESGAEESDGDTKEENRNHEETFKKPSLRHHLTSDQMRTDSVDSLDESIQSTDIISSADTSLAINDTDCESLESSLLCLDNNLEDISVDVLDTERNKQESEVKECTTHESKVKNKKKKNKRKISKTYQDGEKGKQSTNVRPNYFVGVQISNSEIHKSIIKVQEEIVAYEPMLSKALVDVATSHITLLIARMDDEAALSQAYSALDEYWKNEGSTIDAAPVQLTFSGLDNFSKNVLYARVVEDEHYKKLLDIADGVRQYFAEKGVCLPNEKPLNPHLTIAKMSKAPRGKGKSGPRKIEPMSYANSKDIHFGCQTVKSLQLLAMNLPKDEKRYYHCVKEILFGGDIKEDVDHTKCCFPRRPIISRLHHRSFSTEAVRDSTDFIAPSSEGARDSTNFIASSVGVVTTLAASLMIVYVLGKIAGRM